MHTICKNIQNKRYIWKIKQIFISSRNNSFFSIILIWSFIKISYDWRNVSLPIPFERKSIEWTIISLSFLFFSNKNRISEIGQRNVARLTIPTPFPFYPIAREILGEAEFLSRNFDNCIPYRCTQLEITIWRNTLNVRRRRGSASLLLLALAIIDWCLFWIRFLLLNSRVIRENGELKS